MTDDLFNTASEEVARLIAEVRETKELLRELSSKLSRIDTRLRRAFPPAFAKEKERKTRGGMSAGHEAPTISPEQATALYEELVGLARENRFEEVQNRLSSLSVADLSLLRQELGASLGKRKPSPKTLIELILGRIKESVMLSKHTNRQELLDRSSAPNEPTNQAEKEKL
jgi:hypothetical protein